MFVADKIGLIQRVDLCVLGEKRMIMCRRPAAGLGTFLIDADKLGCIVNRCFTEETIIFISVHNHNSQTLVRFGNDNIIALF